MSFERSSVARVLLLPLLAVALVSLGHAQDVEKNRIEVEKVADNVYMLADSDNGNVGVSVGEDGVFVIDAKSAETAEEMLAAISKISDKPIRFLLNTHWHADHTGGNEEMARAGAVIVAHENVRKRMSTEQTMEFFGTTVPPAPEIALPVVTFSRDVTFHLNGDRIYVFHVRDGHTDGDAIVYFHKANIIHMGDLFFAGLYPYIGISSGGSVDGMIEVIKHVLSMIDDETIVIGGHGPVSTKSGLKSFLDMLIDLREEIDLQIKSGHTLEEVVASKPSREYDGEWGHGFFSGDQFVTLLYRDLSRSR